VRRTGAAIALCFVIMFSLVQIGPVAAPMQNDMNTGGDAGNSMSAATLISAGSGTGYVDSSDDDYYKIAVSSGQTVTVTMTPPSGSDFDLYLYDTNQSSADSSSGGGSGETETVEGTASDSGYFYIDVFHWTESGNYSMTVTITGGGSTTTTTTTTTPPEKPPVEMPLARVKSAVASREGVSQDNVEIYFCVPAELIENENFAVGVVVNDQKSIVFLYDNSTNEITVENEYTASTGDELQAMTTIILKNVTSPYAQDHLGRFNVNKIVPFGIVKVGSTYTFNYYDGYAGYPVNSWGYGRAVLDENMEVSIVNHAWI